MDKRTTGGLRRICSALLLGGFLLQGVAAAESTYESRLRELISAYRERKSLQGLSFDGDLYRFAAEHSRKMDTAGALSHDGFGNRFKRSGYRSCVENVGWNYPTPEAMFEGWKNSSGHDANLLSSAIGHVGIARAGSYVTFFACGR